jgi:hypothetical protein
MSSKDGERLDIDTVGVEEDEGEGGDDAADHSPVSNVSTCSDTL